MSVLKNFMVAFDQLANTIIWIPGDGFGFPDETLSARAWRLRSTSSAYKIIDSVFFWDREGEKRHCQLSYESELLRLQLPKAYR